jgi:hypothetical protein
MMSRLLSHVFASLIQTMFKGMTHQHVSSCQRICMVKSIRVHRLQEINKSYNMVPVI